MPLPHVSSDVHVLLQPSPGTVLPSSQTSPGSMTPSPQRTSEHVALQIAPAVRRALAARRTGMRRVAAIALFGQLGDAVAQVSSEVHVPLQPSPPS